MDVTRRETLEDCLKIFQADMRRFGTESSLGMNARPGLEIPHEISLKKYRIIQEMIQELKAGIPLRETETRRPPAKWQTDGKERSILNVEDYLPGRADPQSAEGQTRMTL